MCRGEYFALCMTYQVLAFTRKKNFSIWSTNRKVTRWTCRKLFSLLTVHDGDYWRLLTPGEYEVIVVADGYVPVQQLMEVTPNGHHPAPILNFELKKIDADQEDKQGYQDQITDLLNFKPEDYEDEDDADYYYTYNP